MGWGCVRLSIRMQADGRAGAARGSQQKLASIATGAGAYHTRVCSASGLDVAPILVMVARPAAKGHAIDFTWVQEVESAIALAI